MSTTPKAAEAARKIEEGITVTLSRWEWDEVVAGMVIARDCARASGDHAASNAATELGERIAAQASPALYGLAKAFADVLSAAGGAR